MKTICFIAWLGTMLCLVPVAGAQTAVVTPADTTFFFDSLSLRYTVAQGPNGETGGTLVVSVLTLSGFEASDTAILDASTQAFVDIGVGGLPDSTDVIVLAELFDGSGGTTTLPPMTGITLGTTGTLPPTVNGFRMLTASSLGMVTFLLEATGNGTTRTFYRATIKEGNGPWNPVGSWEWLGSASLGMREVEFGINAFSPDSVYRVFVEVSNGIGSAYSDTLLFSIWGDTTGIASLGTLQASIGPNPAKGSITIEVPDLRGGATFSLYDLSGRRVLDKFLTQELTMVELALSPGMYLYRIVSEEGSNAGRLLVE